MLCFVPTNLHLQQLVVFEEKAGEKIGNGFGESEKREREGLGRSVTYDHITFGAPAAFVKRFKGGRGLRHLVKSRCRYEGFFFVFCFLKVSFFLWFNFLFFPLERISKLRRQEKKKEKELLRKMEEEEQVILRSNPTIIFHFLN